MRTGRRTPLTMVLSAWFPLLPRVKLVHKRILGDEGAGLRRPKKLCVG